jgi:hypothetical protein
MPPLRVPDRYQRGLAAIIRLSSANIESLRSVLDRTASNQSRNYTAADIAAEIGSIPSDVSVEVVSTILSLYSLRNDLEMSIEELSSTVIDAMEESEEKELNLSDKEKADFRERLSGLLSIDSLSSDLKASEVTSDHERTYCTSRILTDIRPVFEIGHDDKITNARVMHELKIEYHERGATKVIYMAINDDGIINLQLTLDRAQAKASALEKLLQKWSLSDAR